ncbi:nucleoside-diphosphate kinase [Strigomonas culicis]|nr:nucleoside-diphosphate kinase [Strigomonas culicis]|eukprot:EPY33362.1 nucleoside-diphosphate kinase [Strigomonas culicis]
MTFECEQYDQYASLRRLYVLFFFYNDGTVEMIDRTNDKVYLKRTPTAIPRNAFFLGATVNVLGKPTTITGYADEVTRQLCEEHSESTVFLIAESSFVSLGRYISILTEECGFTISDLQMYWVRDEAIAKYDLPQELRNTRVVLLLGVRAAAMQKGLDFVQRSPGTCTVADTAQLALWKDCLKEARQNPLAVFDDMNSSVVVIKPHLIQSKRAGNVIQQLVDLDLEPTALAQVTISSTIADRFLRPYRGVLPNMDDTLHSLEGNAWVLQLISLDDSKDVVEVVRAACGPYDTVVAKKIFPTTIRAKFGINECDNAVHCCDLPGEGPTYVKFFLKK